MLIPPTRCFKGLIGRDVVCRLKNPTRNIKRHNNLPPGCFFLFSSCSVRLLKSHRWGYPKEASVRYQFPTVNSVITTADVVCITLTINNKKKNYVASVLRVEVFTTSGIQSTSKSEASGEHLESSKSFWATENNWRKTSLNAKTLV